MTAETVTLSVPTPGNKTSGMWLSSATAQVRDVPAAVSVRIGPGLGRTLARADRRAGAHAAGAAGHDGAVDDVTAFSATCDASVDPGHVLIELRSGAPAPIAGSALTRTLAEWRTNRTRFRVGRVRDKGMTKRTTSEGGDLAPTAPGAVVIDLADYRTAHRVRPRP